MLRYKNISCRPLTFYGVTFNPNDIKEVPGYINHDQMLRVKADVKNVEEPKVVIIESPKVENVEPEPKKSHGKRTKNK